jgi:hypothetical protein
MLALEDGGHDDVVAPAGGIGDGVLNVLNDEHGKAGERGRVALASAM